jgi:putative transposase
MAKKGHTEEQDYCSPAAGGSLRDNTEICRELGISQPTFYNLRKQYAGPGVQYLRELRQLREENNRLKRMLADLSLDRQILQEIVAKRCEALPATPIGEVDPAGVSSIGTQSDPRDRGASEFVPLSQQAEPTGRTAANA